MPVYCIVENGTSYSDAYSSYAGALAAVNKMHKAIIANFDFPENTESGITQIYLEKDIHIRINRLTVLLSYQDLLDRQDALKAALVTNYGEGCCTIHPIYPNDIDRTDGLVRNAIGQIVIREMRITKRNPNGQKDWKEFIDHVYIWANKKTTKIPDAYENAILSWLAF